MQTLRLDGRAILVTGAGRGLGRSYALELAARGARVVVADSGVSMSGDAADPGLAADVVAEIARAGGLAVACTADLAQDAGSREAVQVALDHFGRLDGVLHNASTVPELTAPDALDDAAMDKVLDINAKASLWLARAAWPHMVRQGSGAFLLTTSAAVFGAGGNGPYGAAKGAVFSLVKCLAVDGAAHGIRVNALAPSARTRMTETFLTSDYGRWLARTMAPEMVCGLATYLLSAACDVSGEIFSVGGGRIGRVVLAESEGVILPDTGAEQVRDQIGAILTDRAWTYPANLQERSGIVATLLGYDPDSPAENNA